MKNKILALGLVLLMTGCASVGMTDIAASHAAKEFRHCSKPIPKLQYTLHNNQRPSNS